VRVARSTGSHFVLQNWQRLAISVSERSHPIGSNDEFLLLLLILLRVGPRHRHAGVS
jgi:hypothetical protein